MIGFEVTKLFFDKKTATDKVDKTTRRVLSKFGAFVRRTAKSSIRKRKSPSPPGTPPSSHTGLLKKFIFFGYDPAPGSGSVVIGPVQLTQNGRGELPGAPSLLEYGGIGKITRHGKTRTANFRGHFRGRPFMGPAFEKEKSQLPSMWKDSIR